MSKKSSTAECEPEVEATADGPSLQLQPLYNYGPPVTVTGQNPIPQDNSSATTVTIAGGSNHTPPANTAAIVVPGGSPNEEMGTLYTPTLASISPATIAAGAAAALVTCTGTNFFAAASGRPGTTIFYGNTQLATNFVSATSVTATFPHNTATVGTVSINVKNIGAASATPRTFTYT